MDVNDEENEILYGLKHFDEALKLEFKNIDIGTKINLVYQYQ